MKITIVAQQRTAVGTDQSAKRVFHFGEHEVTVLHPQIMWGSPGEIHAALYNLAYRELRRRLVEEQGEVAGDNLDIARINEI